MGFQARVQSIRSLAVHFACAREDTWQRASLAQYLCCNVSDNLLDSHGQGPLVHHAPGGQMNMCIHATSFPLYSHETPAACCASSLRHKDVCFQETSETAIQ